MRNWRSIEDVNECTDVHLNDADAALGDVEGQFEQAASGAFNATGGRRGVTFGVQLAVERFVQACHDQEGISAAARLHTCSDRPGNKLAPAWWMSSD